MAYPNPLMAMLDVTSGGLEFYGGFIAAVAAVILYALIKRRSIRWYLDILAPSIMLGLAFGRMGCFLNGCCWGATTQVPWAVSFPYGSLAFEDQVSRSHELHVPAEFLVQGADGHAFIVPRDVFEMSDEAFASKVETATAKPNVPANVVTLYVQDHFQKYGLAPSKLRELAKDLNLKCLPLHPTQVYGIIGALIIAWVLSQIFWMRQHVGMVLGWLFVLYPINRFLLEAVRTDNALDTFGLTISQGVSVAVLPLAVVYMLILRRMKPVPTAMTRELAEREAKRREEEKKK
jgi:phosphatidylglycerol:prolipoprotein diacylglycerol transferase